MSRPCAAFLSYVRFDDQHENGRLTQLRERLSGEVRLQTGGPFEIFQDRSEIAWGEQWRQRIEESLDAVTFLIPILTPGFFRSEACRGELERFLERERRLLRNDLILPVLYVNTPVLAEEARRKADSLTEALAARQYLDWRELRFEPWTSPSVGRVVARMAEQIVAAKPLEILGDGEPGDVVIDAAGCHVILFRTTMGRMANLTLRQAGGGEWYGLDIAQGRLEVEDCDVTSQSLACIAIHGGAEPRLRRNRIHDGKSGGVYVNENGQGTLEDNDLRGNLGGAWKIDPASEAKIRRASNRE